MLAIAGLLYLLGTAADPLVHAFGAGAAGVEVVQVEGSPDAPGTGESPAHAEGPCLVCKIAGPVALSPLAPSLSPRPVEQLPAALPPSAAARTSPQHAPSQPRAPPHA